MGARPVAMGEAFTGLADDINAIYWNPAGLVNVNLKQAAFMRAQWFQDISFNWAAYAQPAFGGNVGLSLFYLGSGSIQKYDNAGNSQNDTYSDYDSALSLSYARTVKNIPLGVTLKVLNSKLEDESATGFAADVGMKKQITTSHELTLGVAVQNIGAGLKYVKESSPLPLTVRTGVSLKAWKNRLLVASDLDFPADNEISAHAGVEYGCDVGPMRLLPRIGYKTNTVKDMNVLSGLSLGFGVNYGDLCINYAWVPYWELGDTNRIDVGFKFGNQKKNKVLKGKPGAAAIEYSPGKYECVECVNIAAENVHFDFGSYTVKDSETPLLDTIAELLLKYDPYSIHIAGYSDSLEYYQHLGLDLSQKRADFVMQYLITKGVSAEKMTATGYGKDEPNRSGFAEESGAASRRVEFMITTNKDGKEERFDAFAASKEKDRLLKVHFALGSSLFAENRFKESIGEFNKVLVLSPGHAESQEYINKAQNILNEKTGIKGEKKEEKKEDKIDIKLAKMRELFNEAQDLFKRKKYSESIAVFRKVLLIDPMHTESMKYIMRANHELSKHQ